MKCLSIEDHLRGLALGGRKKSLYMNYFSIFGLTCTHVYDQIANEQHKTRFQVVFIRFLYCQPVVCLASCRACSEGKNRALRGVNIQVVGLRDDMYLRQAFSLDKYNFLSFLRCIPLNKRVPVTKHLVNSHLCCRPLRQD